VKIGLAQINTRVGAIDANTRKVLDCAERARSLGCDLVLFPELTLCGYPPEDLLLHRGLRSRVEAAFGPIDIWVNNAMVSVFSPIKEMTPGDFRRVTEVTYLGCVHGTLAALRRMLPRDRGIIVQVGSALAYRGIPLQAAYCGAKHAIQGFTDSLRCELLHDGSGVRVTEVHLPVPDFTAPTPEQLSQGVRAFGRSWDVSCGAGESRIELVT